MAVLEIDEACLPSLLVALRPRLIVLTNIFRDQLDRFGEPESLAAIFHQSIFAVPEGCEIIANADDPLLWHAVEGARPIGFGVEALGGRAGGPDAEPDACPACGSALTYLARTMAHLGKVWCGVCRWRSNEPAVLAHIAHEAGLGGVDIRLGDVLVHLAVGGIHNAYNAAAAWAAAGALGISPGKIAAALESYRPRFGRSEELSIDGHPVHLMLMKNPAGAGALIEQVASDPRVGAVVVAVSDRVADGRDTSWIWDTDMEHLADVGVPVVASGTRAADVAVRLKYAGAEPASIEPRPLAAARVALGLCPPERLVVMLATYTSMLGIRRAAHHGRRYRVSDSAG